MTHYWWRSLGGPRYRPYRYEVMARHEPVEVGPELLKDWLALFVQTLREHLPDELARPWYERARRIAASLQVLAERRNAGKGATGPAYRP
jgi:hemoglobin